MENRILQLPTEIARFKRDGLLNDIGIQWLNPFDGDSLFEFTDDKGRLIYQMYIQQDFFKILGIEKFIYSSYIIEIKELHSVEIKLYSITY